MITWTTKNGVAISRILTQRCNCYVVRHRGRFLLVDTSRRMERNSLTRALDSLGITRLSLLVLTHCHFDHTENAAFVRQRFKAPIAVHTSEAPLLEAGKNAAICGTVWPTRLLIRAVTEGPGRGMWLNRPGTAAGRTLLLHPGLNDHFLLQPHWKPNFLWANVSKKTN